jgi:hypothetical protein
MLRQLWQWINRKPHQRTPEEMAALRREVEAWYSRGPSAEDRQQLKDNLFTPSQLYLRLSELDAKRPNRNQGVVTNITA